MTKLSYDGNGFKLLHSNPPLPPFMPEKIQYALNIFIVDLHLRGNNSNIDDRNNYCYYSRLWYSYEILQ